MAVADGAIVIFSHDQPRFDGVEIIDPRVADVPLERGDQGDAVRRLQRLLSGLNLYRGPIDAKYGPQVASAVMAYHKLLRAKRQWTWQTSDWSRSDSIGYGSVLGRHSGESDRVEVDIGNQLMYVIRGGRVAAVVHVSTGNGATYWSKTKGPNGGYRQSITPRGNFALFKHISGWRETYLGGLYKPWYFHPAFAIHGSGSVPAGPASHGCVRVPTWEADHLDSFLRLGLPVHIWDA